MAVAAGFFTVFRGSAELPLRVGTPAPDFASVDLSGQPISLESLRGRVVFVNFWATWCAPCRTEAPSLERLYRRLKPEGFEILAVSIDKPETREAVGAFQTEFELSFPVLLDSEQEIYQAFKATGVPETFLVDPKGRVVERFVGPRNWGDPRYARAVRRLLAAAQGPVSGG